MRSTLMCLAVTFGMAAPAVAQEGCLLVGQNCVDLHDYLASLPKDATVDSMRERVLSILMAEYFPDYPANSSIRCAPNSALKSMIANRPFQRLSTPFPAATNTPPLNEYLIETGERFCYIGPASEGNS